MVRISRHLSANTGGLSLVAALILAGLLAQCFMTLARGAPQTAVLPDEIVHRPTVIPDHILLCWFADPATLQAVTCRTDLSVIESCGEIAVDLVLQGHDHTYARTKMMIHEDLGTRARSRSVGVGTVHVISVSGPKMYPVDKRPFMSRTAQGTQLCQIITIDGDPLHYEARTVTGRRHDAFTLRKRVGQSNQLVEQFSTSQ